MFASSLWDSVCTALDVVERLGHAVDQVVRGSFTIPAAAQGWSERTKLVLGHAACLPM
jgi:hypothetical protein